MSVPKEILVAINGLLALCGENLDSLRPPAATAPAHKLHSEREAREYLGGISRTTLYREVRAGRLRPVKVGRRVLFDVADLDAYIARLKREGRRP